MAGGCTYTGITMLIIRVRGSERIMPSPAREGDGSRRRVVVVGVVSGVRLPPRKVDFDISSPKMISIQ